MSRELWKASQDLSGLKKVVAGILWDISAQTDLIPTWMIWVTLKKNPHILSSFPHKSAQKKKYIFLFLCFFGMERA